MAHWATTFVWRSRSAANETTAPFSECQRPMCTVFKHNEFMSVMVKGQKCAKVRYELYRDLTVSMQE